MDSIGAIIIAAFTFASSLVFTPQQAMQDVLGQFDKNTLQQHKQVDRVLKHDENKNRIKPARLHDYSENTLREKEAKRASFKDRRLKAVTTGQKNISPTSDKVLDQHRQFAKDAKLRKRNWAQNWRDRWEKGREKAVEHRQEWKSKVSEFRDEHKQEIVTKICDRFETVNDTHTAKFGNASERMIELMGKIESRSSRAAANGVDVTACDSAIDTANAAIAAVQDGVNAQAGITYACEFGSESTVGSSLSTTRALMGSDMKNVRDSLHQAKTAMTNALHCMNRLKNVQ